jgi:hypothetical protein
MATSSDHDRIGRSGLAVPDPKLNASQILAWVICWPWNVLWTVCAFNPVFWLIEVVVREFRSGLEEISTGQFREIERELMGGADANGIAVAPHNALSGRSALVVGDPLPGWSMGSSLTTAEYRQSPAVAVPPAWASEIEEDPSAEFDTSVEEAHQNAAVGDGRESDAWSWVPPGGASDRRATQQPANWYPVGELRNAPKISATPLKSAIGREPAETSPATPIPPSVLDAWGNLPPGDKRSSPPLN